MKHNIIRVKKEKEDNKPALEQAKNFLATYSEYECKIVEDKVADVEVYDILLMSNYALSSDTINHYSSITLGYYFGYSDAKRNKI